MNGRTANKVNVIDTFAMSNLRPSETGVEGTVIWVSAGEFSRADGVEAQRGPRIEVVLGGKIAIEGLRNAVSVRLTRPPEVLGTLPGKVEREVVRFVETNREVLLRHWSGDVSTREMLDLLRRV